MSDGEFKEVKGLTAKQIKALAKPGTDNYPTELLVTYEFAANPDKFYPTATLRKLGFERAQCSVPNDKGEPCGHYYWRHTPKKVTCGDSQCEKKYTFIGVGTGKGRNGPKQQKITYADAWQGFRRSLSSARVPCTPIARYPVVARWRADVDYVAAGIFCFQPYCVTGELQPPANPLICPQFCLRFNDLDNIGLTGRHYSGFIMLGIQVFNSKDNYKFWNSECVEFNYRWLTEELMIDPDEITFIEDVWAGGGNLGPSIEFFVGGLELGNMVFMQYKTYPDGRREPLQVQVIDVGIGLERVPWLINGSATSYCDVFPRALEFVLGQTGLKISGEIWDRFGPYSCLLNVDEVTDVDQTWAWIGKQINVPAAEIKAAIEPIRDVYMILDHTRSVLMAIEDGSLPSNVGGASNIRNILRRCFQLIEKHGWWPVLDIDTHFMELFARHRADLATVYDDFKPYPSFTDIIKLEWNRWKFTDAKQKDILQGILTKQKGKLTMDDWIRCITTFGLPAEFIAKTSGIEVPGNLYHVIAEQIEQTVKVAPTQLYSTAHLPPTDSLYFTNHKKYDFDAKVLEVFPNVTDGNKPNIVVLDQSSFYPTSGGQEHDTGSLTIEGKTYKVIDALKVGPTVLHVLDAPLPKDLSFYKGKQVSGIVDAVRREQLRNNHTATHIVFAACRRVLGPHVWQHGAKKTVRRAHLDITHYSSLTFEQLQKVENEANRIVHQCKDIKKGWFPKDEAERAHGFTLYQGGIVPGNEVRVVQILDTDVEACCGTHADNTAEVGSIKLQKATRISDGILRLYYVAGEGALRRTNKEAAILANLVSSWGVTQKEVVPTATRFFHESKTYRALAEKQSQQLIDLQIKCHVLDPSSGSLAIFKTDESNPRLFISTLPNFAEKLRDTKKGVVFIGETFMYGILGNPAAYDFTASFQPYMVAAVTKEDERLAKKKIEKDAEDAKAALESKELKEVVDNDSDDDDEEEEKKPKKKATPAPSKTETKEPVVQKAKASGIRIATSVNARPSGADGPKKKAAAVKVDGIIEASLLSFPAALSGAFFDFLVDAGFTPSEADRKKPVAAAPVAAAAAGGEKKTKEPKGMKEADGTKDVAATKEAPKESSKKGKEAKGKKEGAAAAPIEAAPAAAVAEAAPAKAESGKKGKVKKEAAPTKTEAAAAPVVAAEPVVAATVVAAPKEEAKKGKGAKKEAKKEAAAPAKVEEPVVAVAAVVAPVEAAAPAPAKAESGKKGGKGAKKEATPAKTEAAAPKAAEPVVTAAPVSPEPKKAATPAKTEAAKAERPKSAKPKAEPKAEAPKGGKKGKGK